MLHILHALTDNRFIDLSYEHSQQYPHQLMDGVRARNIYERCAMEVEARVWKGLLAN